jgi:hypothetical protein
MNDKLLDTLRGKPAPVLVKDGDAVLDEEDQDEVKKGCYGYLRGVRDRACAIHFRLRKGNPFLPKCPAGHYALIYYSDWLDDGTGFDLEYDNGLRITVTGRGLWRIYERILQNRVTWLQEEGRDTIAETADPEAPRIYAIKVERREEEAEA